MKLPHTFFYKFFKGNKENSFFIIDKTIYNHKPLPNGGGIFFVGKKKFGIDVGLKLSKLEELYFSNNDSELKKYGNDRLKEILSKKEILADEKEISKDYHGLGEELEFVEFVLYNLLKKKKTEKHKVKPIKILGKNSYLIDRLFDNDCFVRKGRLYSLNKGGKDSVYARINNQDHSMGESLKFDLEELEKKYLNSIEEKINKELTKGQESLLSKIERLKEKKELIDLMKKREFHDAKKNIGFKKDSKGFFVTTKAPEPKRNKKRNYVLYEPHNKKYYRFEEALIGVKLVKQDKGISWQSPIVINPYMHPGLPSNRAIPYQKICEGKFDYNKAVQGLDLESAVNRLLLEGRRLILNGYFGASGAHSDLAARHFQRLEVKDFDAKEVTNEYTK